MQALVLTCDKYHAFARHCIRRYELLWPDNPFTFVVPYQHSVPAELRRDFSETKVRFVQTPAAFQRTIDAMLAGVDENEWVYWCMDDKYVIDLNVEAARNTYDFVGSVTDTRICGITFAYLREVAGSVIPGQTIGNNQIKFLEKHTHTNPWLHQFYRARTISGLFRSFPEIVRPKEMDTYTPAYFQSAVNSGDRFFTLGKTVVSFGEITHRGMITRNCMKSMMSMMLDPPDDFEVCRSIVIDSVTGNSVFHKLRRLVMAALRSAWSTVRSVFN